MLGGMQVDHELRRGAMRADVGPRMRGERAPEAWRRSQIQPAVPFTEGDMVLDLEIEGLRRAPATHFGRWRPRRHRPAPTRAAGWECPAAWHPVRPGWRPAGACLLQLGAHAIDIGQQRRDVLATLLWPGRSPWNARCARLAAARYGSVPTCAALPALRCVRHPVGSHGWPGGQPLLCGWVRTSLGSSMLFSRLVVGYRRFVARLALLPAPATSSTPSRKPG